MDRALYVGFLVLCSYAASILAGLEFHAWHAVAFSAIGCLVGEVFR